MKILMFRHGATKGNMEGRYVGCTDESITKDSVEALKQIYREKRRLLKRVDLVFLSPRRRCVETADILFPHQPRTVIQDFRECDFGEFEYLNYEELNGNPDYQAFIDSNGEKGFPNGETKADFQERCVNAFREILEGDLLELSAAGGTHTGMIAMVIHGGTMMSILDAFSFPHKDYFEWQTGPGQGLLMDLVQENQTWLLENIEHL